MLRFELKGLDKLQKKLSDLERRAKRLHGTHAVSFSELFPSRFMKRYTNFDSIDAMYEA